MSDSNNGFGFSINDPFEEDPKEFEQDPKKKEGKGGESADNGKSDAAPTPENPAFTFTFPNGFIAPENMNEIMGQLNQIGLTPQTFMNMGNGGSLINRDHVRDIARRYISSQSELPIGNVDINQAKDAFDIANTWLDGVVNFPITTPTSMPAWSRRDWLDASINSWHDFVEPLAEGMATALTTNFTNLTQGEGGFTFDVEAMESMGLPAEVFQNPQFIEQMKGMMRSLMGMMVATQLGQALGQLATSVTGSHDVAVPIFHDRNDLLGAKPNRYQSEVHLLPQNIAQWSNGLGIRDDEVRIYLALRESAAARLFTQVPWLYEYLRNALTDYGRGIKIDMQAMSDDAHELLESGKFDPSNPETLNNAISAGLFTPEQSEVQGKAIARIEMILALIEGWIDHVVRNAGQDRLPSYNLLNETLRRSRATNAPVQQLIKNLLGVELSPRKMRECATFWNEIYDLKGQEARDERWEDPALLPQGEDLGDVAKFLAGFEVPDDLSGLI